MAFNKWNFVYTPPQTLADVPAAQDQQAAASSETPVYTPGVVPPDGQRAVVTINRLQDFRDTAAYLENVVDSVSQGVTVQLDLKADPELEPAFRRLYQVPAAPNVITYDMYKALVGTADNIVRTEIQLSIMKETGDSNKRWGVSDVQKMDVHKIIDAYEKGCIELGTFPPNFSLIYHELKDDQVILDTMTDALRIYTSVPRNGVRNQIAGDATVQVQTSPDNRNPYDVFSAGGGIGSMRKPAVNVGSPGNSSGIIQPLTELVLPSPTPAFGQSGQGSSSGNSSGNGSTGSGGNGSNSGQSGTSSGTSSGPSSGPGIGSDTPGSGSAYGVVTSPIQTQDWSNGNPTVVISPDSMPVTDLPADFFDPLNATMDGFANKYGAVYDTGAGIDCVYQDIANLIESFIAQPLETIAAMIATLNMLKIMFHKMSLKDLRNALAIVVLPLLVGLAMRQLSFLDGLVQKALDPLRNRLAGLFKQMADITSLGKNLTSGIASSTACNRFDLTGTLKQAMIRGAVKQAASWAQIDSAQYLSKGLNVVKDTLNWAVETPVRGRAEAQRQVTKMLDKRIAATGDRLEVLSSLRSTDALINVLNATAKELQQIKAPTNILNNIVGVSQTGTADINRLISNIQTSPDIKVSTTPSQTSDINQVGIQVVKDPLPTLPANVQSTLSAAGSVVISALVP